jgi:hypothetical protein
MTDEVLEADELLSWARRVGDEVRVHLRLPGAALEPGPASVKLANGRRRFRLPAEVTAAEGAVVVTFSAPQAGLGRAAWRLAIQQSTSARFIRVRARLLAAATSPVALLPGPEPATRMPPPTPRTRRPGARRRRWVVPRRGRAPTI